MSKTMNRRAMLTGATMLPMLAIPAFANAVPAIPANQAKALDADFIATVTKIKSEVQEMYLTDKASMAKFRATMAKYPPLPDVLKMTERDAELGLPMTGDPRYPGYFTTFQLSELEKRKGSKWLEIPIAEYKPPKETDPDCPVLYYPAKGVVASLGPNPEADARMAELKAAIRKWKAACERVERAAGNDEANKRSDAFWDTIHQRYRKLVAYKPTTIEGLTAKAELVWSMHIGDNKNGLDLGDTTDVRMISEIFNDIRRLANVV